jgi:hypothetical protein
MDKYWEYDFMERHFLRADGPAFRRSAKPAPPPIITNINAPCQGEMPNIGGAVPVSTKPEPFAWAIPGLHCF